MQGIVKSDNGKDKESDGVARREPVCGRKGTMPSTRRDALPPDAQAKETISKEVTGVSMNLLKHE